MKSTPIKEVKAAMNTEVLYNAIKIIRDRQNLDPKMTSYMINLINGSFEQEEREDDRCVVCEFMGESICNGIEDHHICGRRQCEDVVIPVCRECHGALSLDQLRWLPITANKNTKSYSFLYGWSDICKLLFMKTGAPDYRDLESGFVQNAYYLRTTEI